MAQRISAQWQQPFNADTVNFRSSGKHFGAILNASSYLVFTVAIAFYKGLHAIHESKQKADPRSL
jgi:hypothetical protein